MTDTDIHSCGYYCDRPVCIKAQRNELRDKLLAKEWVGLTDDEIFTSWKYYADIVREVEAKLKEKNGG
jgi:hypothetical protein